MGISRSKNLKELGNVRQDADGKFRISLPFTTFEATGDTEEDAWDHLAEGLQEHFALHPDELDEATSFTKQNPR